MPSKQQYLIRLSVENFKNVKTLSIRPNRYITRISGANGAGKTSALDAIFYALAPRKTVNAEFIRKGEKTGRLELETSTHIILRTLDENGGTLKVVVKESNTLVQDPIDWLESLTGELGFDPLRFMRLKPEDQFDVLKEIVPETSGIEALEEKNEADYLTITTRKAEAKRMEATRTHLTFNPTLPEKPIDIDALLSEARAMETFNANIQAQREERASIERAQEAVKKESSDNQADLKRLRDEVALIEQAERENADALRSISEQMERWKPLPEPKDRRELDERIGEASETNTLITTNNAARAQNQRFEAEVKAINEELENLKANIRDRKLTIGSTLEKAKWPVAGLGFATLEEGSGGRERKNPKPVVTYKGLPLTEASTGEQIRVSAAIGMAGKPDLRFLLIREGSLLDDDGLAILEKMAHENDYQIVMEVVDNSGKVGVFMQEGEVAAVNAEPEPETAPAKQPRAPRKKKEVVKITAKD